MSVHIRSFRDGDAGAIALLLSSVFENHSIERWRRTYFDNPLADTMPRR